MSPAGTMDEVSSWNALCLPSNLTASTSPRSFRRILLIPIVEGPKCRSRREARALRATPKPDRRKSLTRLTPYAPIEKAFFWETAPRYLIVHQDGVYGTTVRRRLTAMGIRDRPIARGSPWQNGYAERLIGSIRRKCLDHIVVLGEAHLRRTLRAYANSTTICEHIDP